MCACTNLTEVIIPVDFTMKNLVTTHRCAKNIGPGGVGRCTATSGLALPWNCVVSRQDGRPANAKRLACTLSTLDAAGGASAVVPVDKKQKITAP